MTVFEKPVHLMRVGDIIISRGLRGKIVREIVRKIEPSRKFEYVKVSTDKSKDQIWDLGGIFETTEA